MAPIRDVKVSVIMPLHNAERWMKETMDSIFEDAAATENSIVSLSLDEVLVAPGERERVARSSDSDVRVDKRRKLTSARECDDEEANLCEGNQIRIKVEISVYNDASTDSTPCLLRAWQTKFQEISVSFIVGEGDKNKGPVGVGAAKNRAVAQSSGTVLLFQDGDDLLLQGRLRHQVVACLFRPHDIVGSYFWRIPINATPRYTMWNNRLSAEELMTQRFRECTVIMPTWAMCRRVFEIVGGFDEGGKGTPEDLIFFLRHIELGGGISKVARNLLAYRFHASPSSTSDDGKHREACMCICPMLLPTVTVTVTTSLHCCMFHSLLSKGSASHSVTDESIFALRLEAIQAQVIDHWTSFTIWGNGKEGKRFYNALSEENRRKVKAFVDVNPRKVGGVFFHRPSRTHVPIIAPAGLVPPFVTCVKLDLHSGFEENVAKSGAKEGCDFYFFS